MGELEKRIEELSQAFQDSYDADIDLMTRRDKAQQEEIADLKKENEQIKRWYLEYYNWMHAGAIAVLNRDKHIKELEKQLAEAKKESEYWEQAFYNKEDGG